MFFLAVAVAFFASGKCCSQRKLWREVEDFHLKIFQNNPFSTCSQRRKQRWIAIDPFFRLQCVAKVAGFGPFGLPRIGGKVDCKAQAGQETIAGL